MPTTPTTGGDAGFLAELDGKSTDKANLDLETGVHRHVVDMTVTRRPVISIVWSGVRRDVLLPENVHGPLPGAFSPSKAGG